VKPAGQSEIPHLWPGALRAAVPVGVRRSGAAPSARGSRRRVGVTFVRPAVLNRARPVAVYETLQRLGFSVTFRAKWVTARAYSSPWARGSSNPSGRHLAAGRSTTCTSWRSTSPTATRPRPAQQGSRMRLRGRAAARDAPMTGRTGAVTRAVAQAEHLAAFAVRVAGDSDDDPCSRSAIRLSGSALNTSRRDG
jgi:hypothetical protein